MAWIIRDVMFLKEQKEKVVVMASLPLNVVVLRGGEKMSNNKNYLQRMRKDNIKQIQKIVALHMPIGIEDRKFKSLCMYEIGVTKYRLKEYLEILIDVGIIEFIPDSVNPNKGKWKLVFTENKEDSKKLKLPSRAEKES